MSQTTKYRLSATAYNSLRHEVPPRWAERGWFTDDPERDAERFCREAAEREGYNYVEGSARWVPFTNREHDDPLRWITFSFVYDAYPKYDKYVPGCPSCVPGAFAPDHYPNPGCRSGQHPHCTCDGCF